VKLIVGVVLLLVAAKEWRGRPRGDQQPKLPKWMEAIDSFTVAKAFGMGALLAAVNPKNGLITIAAGAAIAQTGISGAEQAVALVVFIVIASFGVAAPVAIYYLMGDRAPRLLGELKDWMAANNAVIMAVLILVIGVKLIGDGISGLSS
jgi:threonine/homoserine/homoserine lactone efflux protein